MLEKFLVHFKADLLSLYILRHCAGVGPVLGLMFIAPLGSASDRCCSRYGRRRPFIWALCVGVLLGLVVIPRASQIAALLSDQYHGYFDVSQSCTCISIIKQTRNRIYIRF